MLIGHSSPAAPERTCLPSAAVAAPDAAPVAVTTAGHRAMQHRGWPARLALSALALGSLVACASLLGPRTVEISREELQSKLGKQFPVTKRLMKLLDVRADTPRLNLLPGQDRVAATFDLTAKELLMGQDYNGTVGLSFGLRYEPRDLTIRLSQVKIEQVRIDGLPPAYQRLLTGLGAQIAESSLQDYAVHQFKPEDLRSADRMGYEVGEIHVTGTGLAVKLKPRP
jgi:hypothetical protein